MTMGLDDGTGRWDSVGWGVALYPMLDICLFLTLQLIADLKPIQGGWHRDLVVGSVELRIALEAGVMG